MPTRDVVVLGDGGHAAVVADALRASGASVLGCLGRVGVPPRLATGLAVLGDDTVLDGLDRRTIEVANGLGPVAGPEVLTGQSRRRERQLAVEAMGFRVGSVLHPASTIAASAEVEASAQVLARAVIQPFARVGRGAVVNTAAVVEHHCAVGDWVHVAPGAILCGEVTVGEGSVIGAGAVIREGVRIGPRTIVGAGAVVIADFDGEGIVLGIPARRVQ